MPEFADDLRRLRQAARRATPNNHPSLYAATVAARPETCKASITLFHDDHGCRAAILGRLSIRGVPLRLGYLTISSPRVRSLDVVYGGLLHDGSSGALIAIDRELRHLLREEAVDHIMINHLPVRDPLFQMITDRSRFPSAGLAGDLQPHHRFTLAPGPFERTLHRFSRKHRYNLRRADRLLQEHLRGNLQLERNDDAASIPAFLQEAQRISAAGYQGRITRSTINSPVQRAVLEAAARIGSLRCYLLRSAGESIACQMGAVIEDTYWLLSTAFLPGYDRFSPGQVLLLRVLEDLAAQNVRTVDYGFGDAPYKRMYGNAVEDEATIHLYAETPRGAMARVMHEASEGMSRRARDTLARVGLLGDFKRTWRRQLVPSAAAMGMNSTC